MELGPLKLDGGTRGLSNRYGATVTGGGLASCSITLNFLVGRAVVAGEEDTGADPDTGGADAGADDGSTDAAAPNAASSATHSTRRIVRQKSGKIFQVAHFKCRRTSTSCSTTSRAPSGRRWRRSSAAHTV